MITTGNGTKNDDDVVTMITTGNGTKSTGDVVTMITTGNGTKSTGDVVMMITTGNVTKSTGDVVTIMTTENVINTCGRPSNTCRERDYRGKWPGTPSVKHYESRNPTNIGSEITGEKIGTIMNIATTTTTTNRVIMMKTTSDGEIMTMKAKNFIIAPITRRPLNWRHYVARLRNCAN
jgi:hypothetical protein